MLVDCVAMLQAFPGDSTPPIEPAARAMKAIARRGWAKLLKSNGYRETHVVMEKEFTS